MPRNQEVVRQWQILRAIEASRFGVTIAVLADANQVSTRTIRRDLSALQSVGFPIYDEARDDGKYWKLEGAPLKGLEREGFTLAEIAALYVSRALLGPSSGSPFADDLARAVNRVTKALPPAVRRFLDGLPHVFAIKPAAGGVLADSGHVARLLEASAQRRRVAMTYYSASSERTRSYVVEPHRLVYGDGALYVVAFVPDYGAVRTFAVARISELRVLDETFQASDTAPAAPGEVRLHDGPSVDVVIRFARRLTAYVRERTWHPHQVLEPLADGGVRLTLRAPDDWELRSWILSFGASARVEAPDSLVSWMRSELERAHGQYGVPSQKERP
ncbi:MAG: helix-turn-helix transcriptional regulator [Vicinamibacterales bacterium]